MPFTADRTLETAAAIAMEWAERAAVAHQRPAVLVTDRIGEYHGHDLFERYRRGRHVSPRSNRLNFRPGAVVAHAPSPTALHLVMRLADGAAVAVVEHPEPWRLSGWARALGARDLFTGENAPALHPKLVKFLDALNFYGNNGYSRGHGRDGAQRVLADLRAEGLLEDPDLIISALAARGVPVELLKTVATMAGTTATLQPVRHVR
ncbi:hypothetical protein NLX85_06150 [Micromonospora sp. A3M-1-15]|uniref:hypothetical protein n=1 Tax=Micromonospora sp. A3M-1-15 TaxID=2962035 RepID=UPI0020B8C02A|nr:hypothetical protein [Micromonospora sp. A3M-1-15]MCP3782946.1 hypothetical protein [Micromonospora sp. A3M-1-15]